MKISQTADFELLASLNKPIHELHVSLYPEHFTEYNFETIRDSFKQAVTKERKGTNAAMMLKGIQASDAL